LGIPSHTRIILIPADDRSSREYGISRSVVILLLILAVVFIAFLALLMHSFATKHDERQAIQELERQLAVARTEVQVAHELAANLEDMRQSQEQLLLMLGVEQPAGAQSDTLSDAWLSQAPESAAEGMQRAAAVVGSPRPDRWPAKGFVTQEFTEGSVAKGIRPHLGIDIAGPLDGPVTAAAAGVVARTGSDDFLGNFVEIQHGMGYLTVYGHCSRVAVRRGDRVVVGQVIAYVGKSGQASAPHLHFEIWEQGEAINPRRLVAGEPEQK